VAGVADDEVELLERVFFRDSLLAYGRFNEPFMATLTGSPPPFFGFLLLIAFPAMLLRRIFLKVDLLYEPRRTPVLLAVLNGSAVRFFFSVVKSSVFCARFTPVTVFPSLSTAPFFNRNHFY
jgi:hypothetical protein